MAVRELRLYKVNVEDNPVSMKFEFGMDHYNGGYPDTLLPNEEYRNENYQCKERNEALVLIVYLDIDEHQLKGDDYKFKVFNLIVKNNLTGETSEVSCTGFFVAIGHKPNSDLFTNQLDMDETGYLITKGDSTQTNIKGVFAAGDIQDKIYRQAVTAAGSGCMAALEAERYLAELEG